MRFEIKTANELVDPELEARWAARRADPRGDVLQHILRTFIDRGGPIPLDEVCAASPDRPREAVLDALAALDDKDLIQLQDGRVVLAYPFSAEPTPFTVVLPDGEERYACCAIDALGIAAMLGQPIRIRSRCHHCQAPLEFSAEAGGPAPDGDGIMVWVGKRVAGERRVSTSL